MILATVRRNFGPANCMPRERRRVHFSGRVQGVGFRYTCQSLARDFEVAGYVRNLPDGRVELVAEGDRQEIDNFLTAIHREMAAYIQQVDVKPERLDDASTARLHHSPLDFAISTESEIPQGQDLDHGTRPRDPSLFSHSSRTTQPVKP